MPLPEGFERATGVNEIRFKCNACDKVFRAPNKAAGRQCPACGGTDVKQMDKKPKVDG